MPNSSSLANSNNINTVQAVPQQNKINIDENSEILLVVNKVKNSSSENSLVFLDNLGIKISKRNKSVTVNVFFDSVLDSTFLSQNIGSYLNLIGKKQWINFSNATSQMWKAKSKLVKLSLSPKLHLMRIKFENVRVVDELNLMPCKINQNFHKQF